MPEAFLWILNMSLAASWLIGVVLIVRLLFFRMPKWVSCLLWALVALKLMIPISLESPLSLMPTGQTIVYDDGESAAPMIHSGVPSIDQRMNAYIASISVDNDRMNNNGQTGQTANPLLDWRFVCFFIWLIGTSVMLLWGLFKVFRIRKTVAVSVPSQMGVYLNDGFRSPFIMGLLKPRIYVPYGLSEEELRYVLAHEKAHLKRLDQWWRLLAFLFLSVYWFNPMIWIGYVLFCRDIEFACDEKVIGDMDAAHLAAYARTLVELSVLEKRVILFPLAFGETSVRKRIKKVLNYKKKGIITIVLSLLVCLLIGACFLPNPKRESGQMFVGNYSWDTEKEGGRAESYRITITFSQVKNFVREVDEEKGLIWEGLEYEMKGEGPYYERILENVQERGKVFRVSDLPDLLWALESKESDNLEKAVTIRWNSKERERFILTLSLVSDYGIEFSSIEY